MNQTKTAICPHCGTDIEVEKEVFSRDKMFTEHTCRGTYEKSKEFIDQMCKAISKKSGEDFLRAFGKET